MKVFLTGASGLVGSAFARAATRRGHAVIGTVGTFLGELEGLAERLTIDLTVPEAVSRAVLEIFPDVVVNCAAISEPAACDAQPERAEAMNVGLPTQLAQLARHLGARLVHISSEQVFDGARRTPYFVTDAVSPINLYGRQKVASEQAIITIAGAQAAIVRAPLLMGNSPGARRGLHERMLNEWRGGRVAKLYTDEFRQPCTAENLAEVLLELSERPTETGLFHWAGTELLSRFDLGVRIREHFKLNEAEARIVAVTRAEVPAISAQRQACLALDLAPLVQKLKTQAQSISEQLSGLWIPPSCRDWYLQRG